MIDKQIDRKDCNGCKMCGDICPVSAINFIPDNEGFWYPEVDYDKCIQCKKCVLRCPVLNNEKSDKEMPRAFASWSKDDNIRRNSTSGGLYYELAKKAIDMGWYIAGVVFSEDLKSVKHILSNTYDGLDKIMRSKYFQSDTTNIYVETKKLLEAGEKVLFCGTPCQNAALTSFLQKEYNNLFQCDFICRGINSPKAYRRFIESYENKFNSEIASVRFKNKKRGWTRYGTMLRFKNGKKYYRENYKDYWTIGYNKENLYMRPSCHDCHFKSLPRRADITLADFWNVTGFKSREYRFGISLVLTNSIKGQTLFEAIGDRVYFEERSLDEITVGNVCFKESTKPGINRTFFFDNIDQMPFDKLIKKCTMPSYHSYLWLKYKINLRRKLKNYKTL